MTVFEKSVLRLLYIIACSVLSIAHRTGSAMHMHVGYDKAKDMLKDTESWIE